jgi:hypothetical protein
MQRRASTAEAKADLLQKAVCKSEEKVARLEIEKNARVSSAQEIAAGEASQGHPFRNEFVTCSFSFFLVQYTYTIIRYELTDCNMV